MWLINGSYDYYYLIISHKYSVTDLSPHFINRKSKDLN